MKRYRIKHKPVKAWCLCYKGSIWPAYCHSIKLIACSEAVHNSVDHRSWAEMYDAGYRLIRVTIKEAE